MGGTCPQTPLIKAYLGRFATIGRSPLATSLDSKDDLWPFYIVPTVSIYSSYAPGFAISQYLFFSILWTNCQFNFQFVIQSSVMTIDDSNQRDGHVLLLPSVSTAAPVVMEQVWYNFETCCFSMDCMDNILSIFQYFVNISIFCIFQAFVYFKHSFLYFVDFPANTHSILKKKKKRPTIYLGLFQN